MKIIIAGGAGLVGQNLVIRLKKRGYTKIVVIDKHAANLAKFRDMHPDLETELADLAEPGLWSRHFEGADVVVMLQAQIGGNVYSEFVRNNIESTSLILDAVKRYSISQLVHISSSVVKSVADDFYTQTKIAQERLVLASGINCCVLRPTLMFGWFDRKHLGWLSRFMKKVPIFPIPGHGRYMRQPLYVGDFCNVIIGCIERRDISCTHDITGRERIDYIDLIRQVKRVTGSKSIIVRIPYSLFYLLIWIWGLVDKNPPFTTSQLKALVAKDVFELTDWPQIFNIQNTPFEKAIEETFNDPNYSSIVMEF